MTPTDSPANPLRPLAAAALLVAVVVAVPARADLNTIIDAAIRTTDLRGAVTAVSVRDELGREIASVRGEQPMIPASNLKVFTTGAALLVFGADHRFETHLRYDDGRLVVVGDGDPAFGDPDLLGVTESADRAGLDVESFLAIWADAVASNPPGPIRELVVDDRIFDRTFVHPGWPADQLMEAYCAEVAGFNFHRNVLQCYPRPGTGRPIVGDHEPRADWLVLDGSAASSDPGRENSVWILRRPGTNELEFRGNVRHRHRAPIEVTLHDVPQFFATLLADRLEDRGLDVPVARVAALDEQPPGGRDVAPVVFTPISTIVARCNTQSENLYAESLLKRMGHEETGQPGSWANGTAVLRQVVHDTLDDIRLSRPLVFDDGSGLSRGNLVTPSATTAWLDAIARRSDVGPVYVESFAIGGLTGRLDDRLSSTSLGGAVVRAKTGYINGVSCLSGYVEFEGRRRSFSILVNDVPGSTAPAKRLQDRIVRLVARDMGAE